MEDNCQRQLPTTIAKDNQCWGIADRLGKRIGAIRIGLLACMDDYHCWLIPSCVGHQHLHGGAGVTTFSPWLADSYRYWASGIAFGGATRKSHLFYKKLSYSIGFWALQKSIKNQIKSNFFFLQKIKIISKKKHKKMRSLPRPAPPTPPPHP